MRRPLRISLVILAIIMTGIFVSALMLHSISTDLDSRLSKGWFKPSLKVFADPLPIERGQNLDPDVLVRAMSERNFHLRNSENLSPGEFYVLKDQSICLNKVKDLSHESEVDAASSPLSDLIPQITSCLIYKDSQDVLVSIFISGLSKVVLLGMNDKMVSRIRLPHRLVANLYGKEPVFRRTVELGQVPLMCIQSLLASEDAEFLEHRGVNPLGLARALMRNLFAGRYAQGGSTITQQLVKNYFLTSEKTLKRKLRELGLSLLLETKISKDEILENYLNVIYMGQSGPYQIVGYGAASAHYFQKEIESLNLSECVLLAAIVNNPGLYNPFTRPEAAQKRRARVVDRMVTVGLLSEGEAENLKSTSLPKKPDQEQRLSAPFVMDAIFKELEVGGYNVENGGSVYTTILVDRQTQSQKILSQRLDQLEKDHKLLLKNAQAGRRLEGALISADVETGAVLSLVGGRNYRHSQFNRIVDAHRQVGSLVKPFVYLAAFEHKETTWTPLSIIEDTPITIRLSGKDWKPKNYDSNFYGSVPLFFALKQSLNVSTVRLAEQVGFEVIADLLRKFGVQTKLQALPSLSLGAFELTPWEVTQLYLNLANFGRFKPLYLIDRFEDEKGELQFFNSPGAEVPEVSDPIKVAMVTSILKEVTRTGTGRLIQSMNLGVPVAGKTGTTSDYKDSWFAGYTPSDVSLVWVGYDDNRPHELTGATGALPIWGQMMQEVSKLHPEQSFAWPVGSREFELTAEELAERFPEVNPSYLQSGAILVLPDDDIGQ